MSEAAKNLTIAVLMTIADAAVVVWYGGVMWQALSPIIWSRILILLLAALWALSFARIWARAIYSLRQRSPTRKARLLGWEASRSESLHQNVPACDRHAAGELETNPPALRAATRKLLMVRHL